MKRITSNILGLILIIIPVWFGPFIHTHLTPDFRFGWTITCIASVLYGLILLLNKYFIFLKKLRDHFDGKA
jgi:hypothetical protein